MLSRKYLQEMRGERLERTQIEVEWRGRLERSMIVKAEFPKRDVIAYRNWGFYSALFEPAHLYIMLVALLVLNSRYTKRSYIPSIVIALLYPLKTI